jgi:succinylglutamate desuccinylase
MKALKLLYWESILPGEAKPLIWKLQNCTIKLKIPIIVSRSKIEGPTVLFFSRIHGDEINGVEIVRQLITKKINKPKKVLSFAFLSLICLVL